MSKPAAPNMPPYVPQDFQKVTDFKHLITALTSAYVLLDTGVEADFLLELLLSDAPKALLKRMQKQARRLGFTYVVAALVHAVLASSHASQLERNELRVLLKKQKQWSDHTIDPADFASLQRWIESLSCESGAEASLAA